MSCRAGEARTGYRRRWSRWRRILGFGFVSAVACILLPVCAVRADDVKGRSAVPGLAELHAKATKARDESDYAVAEQLRVQRLELIRRCSDQSTWTDAAKAMASADVLLHRMQYKKAAERLKKAWDPFDASEGRESIVFGDVAMKMFEVQQAALAVYPQEHPDFPDLPFEYVKHAIQRAVTADPCQVEAHAARAFLTEPNADESFQPAELQASLLARNRDLLGISYPQDRSTPILPWHAATEFLKAKNNSFVLDDLDYLDGFLDPQHRIRGVDSLGEPFCTVLGGSLLLNVIDAGNGRGGRYVYDYGVDEKRWRRFRPMLVAVTPDDLKMKEWILGERDVCQRVDAGLARSLDLLTRNVEHDLSQIVSQFPDKVRFAVETIKAGKWEEVTKEPGPRAGASLVEQLRFIAKQFARYGNNFPEQRGAARKAENQMDSAADQLDGLAKQRQAVKNLFKPENFLSGDPAPPQQIDAKFLAAKDVDALLATIAAARSAIESLSAIQLERPAPVDTNGKKKPAKGTPRNPNGPEPPEKRPEQEGEQAGSGEGDPTGVRLRMELLHLLDDLRLVALFRAVTAPTNLGPALDGVAAVAQTRSGGVDATADTGAQAVLAEMYRTRGRWEATTRDLSPPLEVSGKVLADALEHGRALLDTSDRLGGMPDELTEAFLRRFIAECRRTKQVLDVVDLLVSWSKRAEGGRTWELPGCNWHFYALPQGLPMLELAAMLDNGAVIAISDVELERVSKALQDSDTSSRTLKARLLAEGTQLLDNPLVDSAGENPVLRLHPPRTALPLFTVALVAERDGGQQGQAGPACLVDEKGRRTLRAEVRGAETSLVFDVASASPLMWVEYPGVDGVIPLGLRADPIDRQRFLRDRRGNQIWRAAADSARPFRIVNATGVELADRSVNYGWQEWRDLDRNVINSFLPRSLFFAPSLPTWLAYRQELTRPAPTTGFRWGVPRPAYRLK